MGEEVGRQRREIGQGSGDVDDEILFRRRVGYG